MNAAEILAGGARLVRTQPKAVAIWGAVYFVACVGALALVSPMFADLMAFQQQALAAQTAGLPPPPPPAGFFGGILLFDGVLLVLLAAIFAAAVRAVVSGGQDTFGFLRFGMDELRLIGLAIILFVIGFVAMFVVGLVIGIAAGAMGALTGGAPGAGAILLSFLLIIAFMVLLIWAEVRISLAGALTVLRGRIVIREAWRATHGRFWTLFGVYLLIGVVYMAVTLVLFAIANPGLLGAYAGGADPAAMQAALAQQQAMFADPFGPRMIATWLIGSVILALGVAFTFGAVATAAIGFDRIDHDADLGDVLA